MKSVVVYGAPLAGKSTLLLYYASSVKTKVTTYADPQLYRRCVALVPHRGATYELLTFSGATPENNSWWNEPLSRSAAVVIALDADGSGADRRDSMIAALASRSDLPAVGCVVFTNCDVQGRNRIGRDVLNGTPFAEWRSFQSRIDVPTSVAAPLEWVFSKL